MESLPRLPNQDLLDFGRLGELMGYDRKLNTLDFPVTPRGYRILGRIPRLPEMVVESVVREFGSFDVMLGGDRRRAGGGRGRRRAAREGDPRGPAAGSRRSILSTGICRRRAGIAGRPLTETVRTRTAEPRGGHHSRKQHQRRTARTEVNGDRGRSIVNYKVGDKVVYPHHGAGKVLKKEKKEMLGERARVPHDQDPSQRHDGHGAERQRGPGRPAARDRRGGGRAGAGRAARTT